MIVINYVNKHKAGGYPWHEVSSLCLPADPRYQSRYIRFKLTVIFTHIESFHYVHIALFLLIMKYIS